MAKVSPEDGVNVAVPEGGDAVRAYSPPVGATPNNNVNNAGELKQRRLVKAKTKVIMEKVHAEDDIKLLEKNVDPEIENWIKMKLIEWDADKTGTFSREEVEDAIEELRDAEKKLANMKMAFILAFSLFFIVLTCSLGAVAIVLTLTKEVNVGEGAEMRVKAEGDQKGKTQLITTTPGKGTMNLLTMLQFDGTSDKWMITDDQLVEMDSLSFTSHLNSEPQFYHFMISELIRVDSGSTGSSDKVDIVTDAGHQIRVREGYNDIEVKWAGDTMWQDVQATRRLTEVSGDAEDEYDWEDVLHNSVQPPDRRLAKGGVVVVGVVHHHHGGGSYHGSGGGGGGCRGWCSVQPGQACWEVCAHEQCYRMWDASNNRHNTLMCMGSFGLFPSLGVQLFLAYVSLTRLFK